MKAITLGGHCGVPSKVLKWTAVWSYLCFGGGELFPDSAAGVLGGFTSRKSNESPREEGKRRWERRNVSGLSPSFPGFSESVQGSERLRGQNARYAPLWAPCGSVLVPCGVAWHGQTPKACGLKE